MAVVIRLSRIGKKNRPYWRIVAVDSRKNRDGANLENLGTYDSLKHKAEALHLDRINAWIAKGATCSETVARILKAQRKATSARS